MTEAELAFLLDVFFWWGFISLIGGASIGAVFSDEGRHASEVGQGFAFALLVQFIIILVLAAGFGLYKFGLGN